MRTMRVGELARRTGLTVRTLHHWDEIGLLRPSRRSEAGYRLYGPEELRRLLQIVLLRGLGLSLAEVRRALDDGGSSLSRSLGRRIEALRAEIREKTHLLDRLEAVARHGDRQRRLSVEELAETVEVITMHEKHYTRDQRQQLAERAGELGEAAIRRAEADWRQLFRDFAEEMRRGTDPSAESVRRLAGKARELIAQFTGGDPGIRRSLGRMYETEGPQAVLQPHGFDLPEGLWEYMARARQALEG